MNQTNDYDVIIVGGGPGGTSLATLLAQAGWSTLVLEASHFPRYHIGESLIPHTYGVFERLGILPKLRDSVFPVKRSVRFVSRSGSESDPFYFSENLPGEQGATWQVERSLFDKILLEHAREQGAEIREGVHVDRVLFAGSRAIGVEASSIDGPSTLISARIVADASGRATVIGKQLGLKRPLPDLHKSSVWAYFSGGERLSGIDAGETTIFRISEDAWIWYIPLPDDIVSVGIVCNPARIFSRESKSMEESFLRQIAQCPPLAHRLRQASRVGPVRGFKELGYNNKKTCGDGWVMIGDARAFIDPIYSSGLYLALESAGLAADSIHEALERNDPSAKRLGRFEPRLGRAVEVIHCLIHAFYDPGFSFREFNRRFPQQRAALIDCLIGDVLKNMDSFRRALATMTPPPKSLAA